MNTNKKTPIIIGILVIVIALVVVFAQQSSKNKPAQIVTPVVSADTFTLADVATHKTQSDCWTAVNGSVYNVTSWIKQHPGGAGSIVSMCGVDASSAFDGQHSGQKRPVSELASFKIGSLK